MLLGYRTGVILPSLALMLALTGAAAPVRPACSPASLYSPRELRRLRTILELRLLALREERLDRAREVIERRLPVDALFTPEPKLPPDSQGGVASRLKQTKGERNTTCR